MEGTGTRSLALLTGAFLGVSPADHGLGRLEKGAAGQFVVEGPTNPEIFRSRRGPERTAAIEIQP